jgi:GGDEF domain-containing protein
MQPVPESPPEKTASSGAQRLTEWLRKLEEQIRALSADGLEAAKARLFENIAAARSEAIELAEQPPPRQVENAPEPESVAAPLPDPLTGLPGRIYAEIELARLVGEPEDCYVALFVVKRVALINAKFGYARGDQVLLRVVAHLAQSLPDFNNLFRWAPCAFLTIAPPKTTYKEIRAKIQPIELTRLTPTLEWEGRSAMVPVAIDCRIISAKDFGTPAELFLRLDTLATDG